MIAHNPQLYIINPFFSINRQSMSQIKVYFLFCCLAMMKLIFNESPPRKPCKQIKKWLGQGIYSCSIVNYVKSTLDVNSLLAK